MLILQSVCSDFALATILNIVRRVLSFIQLVVPIILIVSGTMHVIQMMANPDEKKNMKKLINSFAAAIIVFLLPFVINLTMSVISETGDVGLEENGNLTPFNVSSCWNTSSDVDTMDSSNDNTKETIKGEENSIKEK